MMGDSFLRRKEHENQIMTKNNLRFVIDNWHVISWAFRDKKRVKYIIAAVTSEYFSSNEHQQMQEIRKEMHDMNDQT